MGFEHWIELVGRGIDVVGVGIVVIGSIGALLPFLWRLLSRKEQEERYSTVRRQLGRVILLGLEFLVAGDIVRTVAAAPTLGGVAVLAAIVAIRTFLSLTLEIEIEGRLPWRRAEPAR